MKLTFYVSPIPDPMGWKEDAIQHQLGDLSTYAFPLFALLRQVMLRMMLLHNMFLILVAPFWLQKGRSQIGSFVGRTSQTPCAMEYAGSAPQESFTEGRSYYAITPGNYEVTCPQGRLF